MTINCYIFFFFVISVSLANTSDGLEERSFILKTDCCLCDDFSTDPDKRCTSPGICTRSSHFCTYCEFSRKFIHDTWFTTRRCSNETECKANWYETVSESHCTNSSGAPPSNGTTCYFCCANTDPLKPHYCSDNPNNYITFPVTTTTTTTTPIPTTTPKPTTTTPKPTTTTTKMTTTTSATTATPRSNTCQTCDLSTGLSCSASNVVTCADTEHYCMNTLISEGNRTAVFVRKTCATETECYYDAYLGMKNSSQCHTTSGASNTKGVCHYCCQSKAGDTIPCNTLPIPTDLSSFGDQQVSKSVTCEVGVDGVYKNRTCDPSTPMCMNTVIKATNFSLIKKTCETDTLCSTDWWVLTRQQRPECLTSNLTSLPTTDAGIVCHYCCKSNHGQVCNTELVPNDVVDYINKRPLPTTSPEVDGGWTLWSPWTTCSGTCKGIRIRTRTCSNPFPSIHGNGCRGTNFQEESCGASTCQGSGSTLVG